MTTVVTIKGSDCYCCQV